MATIADVAKAAGVSVKTVSRILSGFEGVSEETRNRVKKAMEELEYYPSAAARSLRGKNLATVSVIGDNLTTTPDSFDIVAGIQSECEKRDKILMIGETGGHRSSFNKLVERFRQKRTDAIIYATMHLREVQIDHSFERCPLVLVNCYDAQGLFPAIVPDDEGGSNAAAHELIRLGHERIAFIGLLEAMRATEMRLQGYRRALEAASLPFDEELVHFGVTADHEDPFEALPTILASLFALRRQPTAIMCGNDKMAMRVFFLLQGSMGMSIPADVSVVGYDDYRLISENLVPRLTTVSLPYFTMGQEAVNLAFAGALEARVERISGRVITRESTAPPR